MTASSYLNILFTLIVSWLLCLTIAPDGFAKSIYPLNQLQGDPLIASKEFAMRIDRSCGEDSSAAQANINKPSKKCILDNIHFLYDQLFFDGSMKSKSIPITLSSQFHGIIQSKFDRENTISEANLIIQQPNNQKTSLMIYQEKPNLDGFSVEKRYYFIHPPEQVFILGVIYTEEGAVLDYWQKYIINTQGQFILSDAITCQADIPRKCSNLQIKY